MQRISHSLRTINKVIVEDYDSARVAARSDVEPWQRRHPHLPMPICPSLQQRPPLSLRAKTFISYARSQPEAEHRQGNACQTLVAGKIVSAGVVAPTPTLTRPLSRARSSQFPDQRVDGAKNYLASASAFSARSHSWCELRSVPRVRAPTKSRSKPLCVSSVTM
jgi:hypothetical protein